MRTVDVSIQIVYTKVGRLEWDKSKNRSNYLKHGYEFIVCKDLFAESNVEIIDTKHDYGKRAT